MSGPSLVQRCLAGTARHQCAVLSTSVHLRCPISQRGMCTEASKDREARLNWVAPENRKEVARVLEIAERAAERWETVYTDFLSPPVAADAMSALSQVPDLLALPWGGYPQAERCREISAADSWLYDCRIAIGREEMLAPLKENPAQLGGVAALQVKGNFMFDPATHRDFLGAILNTGVVRDKVGDILVQGEQGAQVLVDLELVEHFEVSLTKVRSVPVQTSHVGLEQLQVRPPRVDEMRSVEASLRLDAIASAGFRMSRSKMSDLIKGGDVRVNWRAAGKASVEVKAGDVISVAGKGRLEVREVGTTKKDKFVVDMVRYV